MLHAAVGASFECLTYFDALEFRWQCAKHCHTILYCQTQQLHRVWIVFYILLCLLGVKCELVFVSSLQAPQLPWPALKEAGQTAQACVSWRTANPVWEDFTATPPASLNLVDPAVGGTPNSDQLWSYLCPRYYLISILAITGPSAHDMNLISVLEIFWCFFCRYYCAEGAVTSTPTDGITGGPCPEGSYCPEGTVQPVPCDPGTYVAVTHATQCEPCLPGWYCVSGSLYLCPAGLWFAIWVLIEPLWKSSFNCMLI